MHACLSQCNINCFGKDTAKEKRSVMLQGPGLFGTFASLLYLVAALLAFRTMLASRDAQASIGLPRWQARVWLAASGLFFVCAISRQFGLEEAFRVSLRGELRSDQLYEIRRDYQSVFASAIILTATAISTAVIAALVRSGLMRRRGLSRTTILAVIACAAMLLLILVRLVSLHLLDSLLYRGPRLNWFVDIGTTLAVIGLARHYHVSLKAFSRRTRRSQLS